jgi:hypothetical protein
MTVTVYCTMPPHASCTVSVIVNFIAILLLLIAVMSATSPSSGHSSINRSLLACLACLCPGGGAQWRACLKFRDDG